MIYTCFHFKYPFKKFQIIFLRSLETDLKKRMKKEQTGGANKDASKKVKKSKFIMMYLIKFFFM